MNGPYIREGTGGKWADARSVPASFLELTKPGIILSNLLACAAGFWLGSGGNPDWVRFLMTLGGTALVIAGSCTLNNWIDRDIDRLMERTRYRPLPTGRITPAQALLAGFGLTTGGLLTLLYRVNEQSALLAASGALSYVVVYSLWLKRVTTWNTVIGSFSGAIPPLIGWVAASGTVNVGAWALFAFLFLWQPPHFFALAMLKKKDYQRAGIPMLPVVKGSRATRGQILFFVSILLPVSLWLHAVGVVGLGYFMVALVLGGIYLFLAMTGWRPDREERWARLLFRYSLIYLSGMLAAMIFFVQ
ncbi:heme o synthase [Salinithrix halophila]|uniref:Protoheme IX farnesyltransferase n=1 Tax=Salinithrix halophila TaxID=1485204 RepID=A0ABV8JL66_9BACL